MRISSSSIPVPAIASDKPAPAQSAPAQRCDHGADVVQLSAAGAAASSSAASGPSASRIATLKASVQDGSYQVDVAKLANRIVEEDNP